MSVNQARILQYGGLPERGLQALTGLFLVFVVATLALAPDQPPRLFGAETFAVVALQAVIQTRLQILGLGLTDKTNQGRYCISRRSLNAAQLRLPLARP